MVKKYSKEITRTKMKKIRSMIYFFTLISGLVVGFALILTVLTTKILGLMKEQLLRTTGLPSNIQDLYIKTISSVRDNIILITLSWIVAILAIVQVMRYIREYKKLELQ